MSIGAPELLLFLVVALPLLFGLWTAALAGTKNRSRPAYFLLGLLTGPVGLVVTVLLPTRRSDPPQG